MAFEEIRAGLEKYCEGIEEKLDRAKPIVFSVGKPGKVERVCACCGTKCLVSRVEVAFEHVFPFLCKSCTKRIMTIHKQLIEKGFAFKHGFEK